jgi:hypothetical protein
MSLTIDQRKRLHAALLDAYPTSGELALMLTLLRGVVYYDLTASAARRIEYLNIIVQIAAEGWITDFVVGAAEDRPKNPAFQTLAAELAAGPASRIFDDGTDAQKQSALQRIVRPDQPDADASVLLAAISATADAVCVIESGAHPQGTGFLVGPDLVLTNWHVAHPLMSKPVEDLSVLFGLRRMADGALATGIRRGFAGDWLVASRAYDSVDETADPADVPEALALDYSLIRLAAAVEGIAPLTLDPAAPLPNRGTDLVMIQHPQGMPQKISFGRITAVTGEGRRLRYDVNTKPGSSGSPILNHRGTLIGLHHAGDPNFERLARYNQGIPIGQIAADIAARGTG